MSIDVRAGAAGTSRIRYIYTVYVTKSTVILKNSLIGIAVSYAEKATSPHSSPLARKIPWTEEPGGPQSTGSHRVGHSKEDWAWPAAFCGITFHSRPENS